MCVIRSLSDGGSDNRRFQWKNNLARPYVAVRTKLEKL
nr:MAG TPA: hypothetical protein [Caudoviricetes sp.]